MDAEVKIKEKDLERKIQSLDKEFESKKKKLLDLSEQLPQEIKINAKGKEKKTEVVKKGLLRDYERLQSTDLVEENKKLHLQVEGLSNNLKASHQINAELRERNKVREHKNEMTKQRGYDMER
ncbi:hypothetical protein [Bacillus cereus]|uniref:hypothetical protein n=1 Tax=Bacillus cereus TaxID=1396 RepID=UPI0022E815C4|nr:hypothetical protein [Bacillus cereus]